MNESPRNLFLWDASSVITGIPPMAIRAATPEHAAAYVRDAYPHNRQIELRLNYQSDQGFPFFYECLVSELLITKRASQHADLVYVPGPPYIQTDKYTMSPRFGDGEDRKFSVSLAGTYTTFTKEHRHVQTNTLNAMLYWPATPRVYKFNSLVLDESNPGLFTADYPLWRWDYNENA